MSILLQDSVAYLPGAETSVFIRPSATTWNSSGSVPLPIKKLTTALDIVPWGEDNRFPQNITKLMSACSIGLAGLDWKMRALYGNGIIPVRITGYEDEGKKEIVQPLARTGADNLIYKFIQNQQFKRFYLEFLQDWVWFNNCFPEVILSKNAKEITGFVHQESCDSRYVQMNEAGIINQVILSKVWGLSRDQYKTFDPNKTIPGITANPQSIHSIDEKYIKKMRAIDMYNPAQDLANYAATLSTNSAFKSAILPVNYPSPNQPYYQVPTWDGSRVAGWIDIAAKLPVLIASLLNNAFHIKYHIEIPEEYFIKRIGAAKWVSMTPEEKNTERKKILESMQEFLQGADKAGGSFVSYFDTEPHQGKEYNRIKITELPNKITIDKEMLASANINTEILVSMNINPDVLGASVPGGAYGGNKGGSNIREGKLVYDSMLHLERQTTLEPLYLARDYNKWDADIEFRHRDTVLTTLDKGKGTEKTLS